MEVGAPSVSLESLHETARRRAAERKTGVIRDAPDKLHEMALGEEEEGVIGDGRLAAGRKRKRRDTGRAEKGRSSQEVSEVKGEEREQWKQKRKKRIEEEGSEKMELLIQDDLSVEETVDQQGSGESSEPDSDLEGEEREDSQPALEEAMDTCGTEGSDIVPLGRVHSRSVGKVSVRRQLPEWVQHAELVEADIAGHSHPIEEFPLTRVVIRNLRRMGITQLFPVQVSVSLCTVMVWSVD